MKQVFIDMLLSDRTAKAICWTLIHSIWQGVLAAALAGIVIASTRRVRAAIRYNLLTLIMLLLVTTAGITFVYQLQERGNGVLADEVVSGPVVTNGVNVVSAASDAVVPRASTVIGNTGEYLNAHATMVAVFWLLCLTVQLLRLTGGLYQMRRFRKSGVYPPVEGWVERLSALCRMMGIRKKVVLLQSELVSMPVTFGFLKPSILIPLGMLAGLPADQVETILLHELAHIRRNDYLANLFLYITEAVFFFNPGIRWIAARIRQEREACCDDIVLADTPNRNSYFNALVAFRVLAEGGKGAGRLALGRQGYSLQMGIGKTDLLWRIRRMLEKENKKLHVMEKAILSVGLMVILAIGLVSMNDWQAPDGQRNTPALAADGMETDTTPAAAIVEKVPFPSISKSTDTDGNTKTCKIKATDVEGNTFQLTRMNGEITEMVINGNVLSKEDYGRYVWIFEKIEKRRMEREDAEAQEETEAAEGEGDVDPVEAVAPVAAVEPVVAVEPVAASAPVVAVTHVDYVAAEQTVVPAVAAAPAVDPVPPVPPVPSSSSDRWIHRIIDDLKRNGIIEDDDPLSFTLDKDGLIVNDARQVDDLFRLFKAKYINNPKDHFIYKHDGGSTSVEVWVE